ncbi:PREDICTED: endogenous retrovirus group K member 19 Pol protein-like [Corvus brachyrhynchos]|uniref:endogenous retrovirus group K member 19 Pol protein-like n=1 Tax=Corvus brachyrhynchos TaxID=85066 RepID=UPI0008163F88|nr:PREDICTED: endogenous retrovirus group K member 19 Pol protein-like [Corvus brachyrhynchos]
MPVQAPSVPDIFAQARLSYAFYHQNVPALIRMCQLPREQAKAIVVTCPNCHIYQVPSLGSGVNPRGLNSCQLWQTDVTHISQFVRLKHVHVSIDIFSGATFASAHAGEKAKDIIKHFLLAFATLGVPSEIKTDNGPAYVSRRLQNFFSQWGIKHNTGIPYSPTGQSIVERAHQTIKRVIDQQQGGAEINSPVERLCKALSTINFLNSSFSELTPSVVRHFTNSSQAKLKDHPPVLIKDPESHQVLGPFPHITWGKGYACVSMPSGPKWLPGKNIKPYLGSMTPAPEDPKKDDSTPQSDKEAPKDEISAAWRQKQRKSTGHDSNI